MVTFASEVVRKSLTGVRPDDPEAIPLTFVIIAKRCVSNNPFVLFPDKTMI
jgi:hypothetical protein